MHVYKNLSLPTTLRYIDRVKPIRKSRESSPIRKQAMQPQQEYIRFGKTGTCVQVSPALILLGAYFKHQFPIFWITAFCFMKRKCSVVSVPCEGLILSPKEMSASCWSATMVTSWIYISISCQSLTLYSPSELCSVIELAVSWSLFSDSNVDMLRIIKLGKISGSKKEIARLGHTVSTRDLTWAYYSVHKY